MRRVKHKSRQILSQPVTSCSHGSKPATDKLSTKHRQCKFNIVLVCICLLERAQLIKWMTQSNVTFEAITAFQIFRQNRPDGVCLSYYKASHTGRFI